MTTKDRLHHLIERLGVDDLPIAERLLEGLLISAETDPVLRALLTAPEDDEPLTDDDIAALRQGRDDHAAGRTVPLADLKAELGL